MSESATPRTWTPSALRIYLRLRRAYKRHRVLPYSRRKTWDEAKFSARMMRLRLSSSAGPGGRE
jgi:hypothetical protein